MGTSFRNEPWRSLSAMLLDILSMLALPVVTVGLKYLTDGVASRDTSSVVLGVALVVGMTCLARLMLSVGTEIRLTLGERVGFAFDREVAALCSALPGVEHHERADYQDRLELVRRGRSQLGDCLSEMVMVLGEVVTAIGALAVLGWLDPWLLLLGLLALPALWLSVWRERQRKLAEEKSAGPMRLAQHLRDVLMDPKAGKELRVFGVHGYIRARMRQAAWTSIAPRLAAARRISLADALWQIVVVGAYLGGIGFMFLRASQGEATAGDVVAAVYICRRVTDTVFTAIFEVGQIGEIMRSAARLLWLREYADTVKAKVSGNHAPPSTISIGIEFENVSFTYPGSEQRVLTDVSFMARPGDVVALIGENGAGKSTIVKLLSRMYEPSVGRILVDGVDLRELDVAGWRGRLSGAFQDFLRPEFLAHQAVGIGDLVRIDDVEAAFRALGRAGGGDLASQLPQALATQLGSRWNDGVDLSGGQWQKLALGRAFLRDSPLLLFLDEPSASLDAAAEDALFTRYSDAVRAGSSRLITILVSHRFSTVRTANLILVLGPDGSLVEQGAHDELIDARGVYAELFSLQAGGYA